MYIFVLFVISLCFAFDSQLYANTLVMCLPRQKIYFGNSPGNLKFRLIYG